MGLLFAFWTGAMFGFVALSVVVAGRSGDDGDEDEPERDVYAMAERYAYDVGFDEEYIAAMQEIEDADMPD